MSISTSSFVGEQRPLRQRTKWRRVVIVATWLGAEATPAHLVRVSACHAGRGGRAQRVANKRCKQTFANKWCLQTVGRVAGGRKQTANKPNTNTLASTFAVSPTISRCTVGVKVRSMPAINQSLLVHKRLTCVVKRGLLAAATWFCARSSAESHEPILTTLLHSWLIEEPHVIPFGSVVDAGAGQKTRCHASSPAADPSCASWRCRMCKSCCTIGTRAHGRAHPSCWPGR